MPPKPQWEDRLEQFCQHYAFSHNASAAAFECGVSDVSARQTGHMWLKRDDVKKRIEEIREDMFAAINLDSKRLLMEYISLAFSDIADLVDFDSSGIDLRDSKVLKRLELSRAIKKGKDTPSGVEIEMHDKKAPMDSLAKILGMYREGGLDDAAKAMLGAIFKINMNPDMGEPDE